MSNGHVRVIQEVNYGSSPIRLDVLRLLRDVPSQLPTDRVLVNPGLPPAAGDRWQDGEFSYVFVTAWGEWVVIVSGAATSAVPVDVGESRETMLPVCCRTGLVSCLLIIVGV